MTSELPVRYDLDAGVCTVTLDSPPHNAWNPALDRAYYDALDRATADEAVRAIVVTGAGRSFCPGADANVLTRRSNRNPSSAAGRRPHLYSLTIPKPMIAVINGACAGIGLAHALQCDVRFAARGARFSTAYARIGLAAEHGMSWILPRLIGVERALDLLLSARIVDADEALGIGLVSRVHDADTVLDEGRAYAGQLAASCSPRAMAFLRRQVWGDLGRDFTEANANWLRAMKALTNPENPDFVEGTRALVEKRAPRFEPLPADLELPPLPPFAEP